MTKVRFSKFPTGSTVTISALQGGAARGPLTASAWKQAPDPKPGAITFEVYSQFGFGQDYPYGGRGNRGGTNKELVDGATIEMAQFTPVGLMIENVQGAATTDMRDLFFEIDFGERWDAQFLEHSHLPDGFTTLAPDGPTLGRYPMHVAGHVMRGTDMEGNEVLTRDYDDGQGDPPGIKNTTITVTVSDGIHTATKTFTAKVCNWLRFYTDTASLKSYTPNIFTDGQPDNRRGVIYICQDGDFTGAEVGPGIYHYTKPDGIVQKTGTFTSWTGKSSDGQVLRRTDDATQIINGVACDATGIPVPTRSDFPWSADQDNTLAVIFKAGETWTTTETLNQTEMFSRGRTGRSPNCLIDTWGTANSGRVTWSGEGIFTWGNRPGQFFSSNANEIYYGLRFRNIDFKMSDFDPTDQTWREWWNVLYYTNKSGGFAENAEWNIYEQSWNGEKIRNASGTVWTQLVNDLDNGDGTGCFIVRQISTDSSLGNDTGRFGEGETLFADASGGTATFVQTPAAGKQARIEADPDGQSRQNRPRPTPPNFWRGRTFDPDAPGHIGICFDSCIIRGAGETMLYAASWLFRSDTLIRDFWDYGFNGASHMMFDSGLVVAQNSSYPGEVRDLNHGNTLNKFCFNVVKKDLPTIPAHNFISHTALRIDRPSTMSMYKCGYYQYGGHTDATNKSDPWQSTATGGGPQPVFRIQSATSDDAVNIAKYGCFFSGGGITHTSFEFNPITRHYWYAILDLCWLRGSPITGAIMRQYQSRMAFKNCRIGYPAGMTLASRARAELAKNDARLAYHQDFEGSAGQTEADLPDPEPVNFFENCDFEFGADNVDRDATRLSWDEFHRGRAIGFRNCTLTIHEISPGVPALLPENVDPIPA